MKHYSLLGTLCLLFLTDMCFAQRLVKPARGHFGVYSYHYLAREFTANTADEVYTITPLRHQFGLTGEWSLGEHFGLGAHINYSRSKGQGIITREYGHRFRFVFVPIENRIIDYEYHDGILDIYARWYPQERREPLRSFLQLNFGTQIFYGGNTAYPFHYDPARREPQALSFDMGDDYFLALGGGLQYRLGDHWGMDTAIMFTWPGSIRGKPFYFMQYGFQVGVYRVITKNKS